MPVLKKRNSTILFSFGRQCKLGLLFKLNQFSESGSSGNVVRLLSKHSSLVKCLGSRGKFASLLLGQYSKNKESGSDGSSVIKLELQTNCLNDWGSGGKAVSILSLHEKIVKVLGRLGNFAK